MNSVAIRDNSVATRDNSVATENIRKAKQVGYNKCFYVVTKFPSSSQLKEELLSQQRKSCHNITIRIHNQGQHNLCRDKDYFYRNKQNMKEVNSLSRQDAEEQHKKNGNKEILVATKSRVAGKTCVAKNKFYVAKIKSKE